MRGVQSQWMGNTGQSVCSPCCVIARMTHHVVMAVALKNNRTSKRRSAGRSAKERESRDALGWAVNLQAPGGQDADQREDGRHADRHQRLLRERRVHRLWLLVAQRRQQVPCSFSAETEPTISTGADLETLSRGS